MFLRTLAYNFKYLAKKAQKTLVEKRKARKMRLIGVSLFIDEFYIDFSLEILALVAENSKT